MLNFAITDVFHTPWNVGLSICVYTNIPCHLTAYYTTVPPQRHRTSRTLRGVTGMWDAYWCFVAWTPLEQTEAGDTLWHDFELPAICTGQTIWWACKGTVGVLPSPSVSAIFEYTHEGGTPRYLYLRPRATGTFNLINSQNGAPSPNHWLNVKEVIPDEDTTCVWCFTGYYPSEQTDTYKLTPVDPTITNVFPPKLYLRVRREGGYWYNKVFRFVIRTHGVLFQSAAYGGISQAYVDYFLPYPVNPFTNQPWTIAEINALEGGFVSVVDGGIGYKATGRCTQLYVSLERMKNGMPYAPRF